MDPNPLLSTTATAAAALVAIVGGLLVSRVISLATERSGLDERLTDLQASKEAALRRCGDYERRILDIDVEELVFDNLDYLATGPTTLDVPAMLRESPVERPAEDVAEQLEVARRRFVDVRSELAPRFDDGPPDHDLDDLIKDGKVTVGTAERDMYEAVWKQLTIENPPPPKPRQKGLMGDLMASYQPPSFPMVDMPPVWPQSLSRERTRLRHELEAAQHELEILAVQIEHTRLAVARVSAPKGVRGGLWVLGYMTFAGTLIPLALMASGIESMDWRGASAIIVLFASGVGLLMAYVALEVRRMTGGDS